MEREEEFEWFMVENEVASQSQFQLIQVDELSRKLEHSKRGYLMISSYISTKSWFFCPNCMLFSGVEMSVHAPE